MTDSPKLALLVRNLNRFLAKFLGMNRHSLRVQTLVRVREPDLCLFSSVSIGVHPRSNGTVWQKWISVYEIGFVGKNHMTRSVWRADLALAFNTLIWGSTFVLVKRALDDASALLFVAIRFTIAALIMAWIFRKHLTSPGPPPGGILAGVCLFGGYAFQTVGLKLTTPSKAAFLTGLTVVMVPLLSSLVYRVYPHVSEAIGVAVATLGMGLMTLQGNVLGVARGDALEILCALAFAAHIVVVGHYSKMASFEPLAVWQLGTTAVLALAGFWWIEKPFFHPSPVLWVAILVSSLLSTALAFTVQAWAQQVTTATRAALIFALEPVVAWVFAFTIIGERLPAKAVFGAVLILAGLLVAELKPIGLARHPST
jgi:drug/metabolite transporter (DMT)-like permease